MDDFLADGLVGYLHANGLVGFVDDLHAELLVNLLQDAGLVVAGDLDADLVVVVVESVPACVGLQSGLVGKAVRIALAVDVAASARQVAKTDVWNLAIYKDVGGSVGRGAFVFGIVELSRLREKQKKARLK